MQQRHRPSSKDGHLLQRAHMEPSPILRKRKEPTDNTTEEDDFADNFGPSPQSRRVSPDVTLIVGANREELRGFSQCLCLASDFFEALLCGEWAESRSRRVELPDVEVRPMKMLLEFITPGTELRLNQHNVFQLLPLFHKFQMQSCVRSVDTYLVSNTKFGSAASYLRAACDYQLPRVRKDAMMRLISDRNFAYNLGDLEQLACDDKYEDVMAELWPHVRREALTKAQRDANLLVRLPPPTACQYLWSTLVNAASRGRALRSVPDLVHESLPMCYFKAADHDSDDSDDEGRDDTMYSDRWLKRKIAVRVNRLLPDHVDVPPHNPDDPIISV